MHKLLCAAAAAFMLLTLPGGKAGAAAFCAYSGGDVGGEDCSYNTWEQCRATISGLGGFCMRNPHDPAAWRGRYTTR